MPNLYGDILSDVAAEITGSVGLAGSANIGGDFAMFEAIHGSAPDIAGKDIANPSGLLLAAVQMLVHIGQTETAAKIHNAWLRTIEDGVHTTDVFTTGTSKEKVGTSAFADAVIARLGLLPSTLPSVRYESGKGNLKIQIAPTVQAKKELIGIDVFLHHTDRNADALAAQLSDLDVAGLHLTMITNRGTSVWPNGFPETFCTDHWRCRFKTDATTGISYQAAIDLIQKVHLRGLNIIKTENLYLMNVKHKVT